LFIIAQIFEKEKVYFEKIFANGTSPATILVAGGDDMEQNREQQVWQRVLREPEPPRAPDLQGLILESTSLAGIYRRAAEKLTGREKQLARQMLELEQGNLARLRGIGVLAGQSREVLKQWEPVSVFGPPLLMKCYHRGLRCRAEYAARCLDPEYGEIYRELADRQGRQCGMIAELLGRMQEIAAAQRDPYGN
jgi:hypothetical protein